MGVYSPVPIVTDDELAAMKQVMADAVAELAAEGIDYRGCLYGGFMLTPERAEGARVQRALRRPGDAGHPAAA